MTKGVGFGGVLLLLPALSGCLIPNPPPLPLTPLSASEDPVFFQGSYASQNYSWSPALAYDSQGTPVSLEKAGASSNSSPVGIASLIHGGGSGSNVAMYEDGTILTFSFFGIVRSTDWGRYWEIVQPPEYPGIFSWVSIDHKTARAFATFLDFRYLPPCIHLYMSDSKGEKGSWRESLTRCGVEKGTGAVSTGGGGYFATVLSAPPHEGSLLQPNPDPLPLTYPNVVYVCYFDPFTEIPYCDVSTDGGETFPLTRVLTPEYVVPPIENPLFFDQTPCGGIPGQPAFYSDGTVVVPIGGYAQCISPFRVSISEDNGLTWQVRDCGRRLNNTAFFPGITITKDQTAYVVYRDEHELVHLVRSTDKFQSCSDFPVAPKNHTLSALPAITSGDDGRIAIGYLGTVTEQDPDRHSRPSTALSGTYWDVYVTVSLDAHTSNPTFITKSMSPVEYPLQLGCIPEGPSSRFRRCDNYIPVSGIDRDGEGRWVYTVSFGCTSRDGCGGIAFTSSFQTRDVQEAAIIQDRGISLFADKGVLPSLGLRWPDPYPRCGERACP